MRADQLLVGLQPHTGGGSVAKSAACGSIPVEMPAYGWGYTLV